LRHAVVVDADDDEAGSVRTHLGQVAAELLAEVIGPDDVLGVAWSRSVGAMARSLPRLPRVPVVQLTGAVSLPDADGSSIDIVRDVARAAGGPAYVFYAPFTVPDPATAQALRRQPEVAHTFAQVPKVTTAVVGLGRWALGQSTLYDSAAEHDRRSAARHGVCAELSGVFLTQDGEPVQCGLSDRMIGIDADQMRAIPQVLVMAYGQAKVPAVRAALRSSLVDGLVTHRSLAAALLDEA
jgi:DNA-binding transcriptional regulator LsrR (DeoR family)